MKKGDVVQITDETHAWYPALLIVSEAKAWGVQAYVIVPKSNDGSELPALAFNRLTNEQIQKVGEAIIAREAH
jgi:hypothetical protein